MSKSVDIKSLLIGGLLTLLVLSCLGALPWLSQERFGRFAAATTGQGAVILDTATGQAWMYILSEHSTGGALPSPDEFFSPKLDPNELTPIQ
jgi:hypothetical protein